MAGMMLQPLRQNNRRGAVSKTATIAAPLKGLNARDPQAHMEPGYALSMNNFFPEANYIVMRRGYTSYATGINSISTPVQSLLTYKALNGTEKFFAAGGGKIYDISSAGAAVSSKTGLGSNKWQSVNFSNTAGLHLIIANGVDAPLRWSGTAWSAESVSGSISTITNIVNIFQHNQRLWFIEKSSLDLWYLASNAISGALIRFPLAGVANKGGSFISGATFSFNAGTSIDEYLVAITTNGEAIIYTGTDPATDFRLVGVYDLGAVIGTRCLVKVGGDIIVITAQGALPLSKMINNDRALADELAITSPIAELFNLAAYDFKSNFGWEGIVYPNGRWCLFNVPQTEGVNQTQYVQNIVTGRWCSFSNMNANCWGIYNGDIYFGGNGGAVYRADHGNLDGADEINAKLKTAFTYCGSTINKSFKGIQPLMLSPGTSTVLADIDVDFGNDAPTNSFTDGAGSPGGEAWDVATWDVSYWLQPPTLLNRWQTVGKIGSCVAAHLVVNGSGGQVQVNDFNILYEPVQGQVF